MSAKGFFGSLFDFSFTHFVTPKIIKVIFAFVIAVSALLALVAVVFAFKVSPVAGVLMLLIGAPLVFLFYVIIYRMIVEVVMAVFAIAENTRKIALGGPISGEPPITPPSWGPPGSPAPPPSI